jgi:hypothetical protein
MKTKILRYVLSFTLLFVVSCDEPETILTNIIHKDGSVTRKVEMRSRKNDFRQSRIQIPVDSTWTIRDTCIISEKGDTTWLRTAEKLFRSIEGINAGYENDSTYNKDAHRVAEFKTKFRWFNNIYRYSEKIKRSYSYGYPVSEFLNKEELLWFYSPWSDQESKLGGSDSTRYKALSDSVKKKTDEWILKSFVGGWAREFSIQVEASGNKITQDTLNAWEKRILKNMKKYENDFDSLWKEGVILNESIGTEYALKYRAEADSAFSRVEKGLLIDFARYVLRISMPGKLIASNGFADSTGILYWPVISDYFCTEDYEMWAESKIPNIWAWVVSGVFIVFVFTGLVIRKRKRG